MDMKILCVLLFIIVVQSVSAFNIEMQIDQEIDGYVAWMNVTPASPQRVSIAWQNAGSIYCKSRARVDFDNESGRAYTSWGPEAVMKPGDTVEWNLYSYLNEGEYNITIRVNHCNEIYNYGPYHVSVEIPEHSGAIEISGSRADDKGVEIVVSSSKDLENVVLIPASYPLGWIFESGEIGSIKSGETKSVFIPYESMGWEGRSISFVAATEDGSYVQEKPVILRRQEISYNWVMLIFVVGAALMIYLYYKKSISLSWKR